jgi:hypothetical protein
MAKQYDKDTILNALKLRVAQKGFKLNVKKGDGEGIHSTTPTTIDLLEGIAEATSDILTKGTNSAEIIANDFSIGSPGIQQDVATVAFGAETNVVFDMTTDPQFFTWIETFHSLLNAVYPEPGSGAPDVFATALKSLVGLKPTALNGKITKGSSKVKVTI